MDPLVPLRRARWCALVGGALVAALVSVLADEPKKPSPLPSKDGPAQSDPLPPLPSRDLPPLTRPRPDAAKMRYVRESVFVKVDERIIQADGKPAVPRTNVMEDYLRSYLRRAGHAIASTPEAAVYRLEGQLEAAFLSDVRARGRVVAWRYRGSSMLRLLGKEGAEIEVFEVPELLQENVRSEESAALHLRREMAKLQWDKVTLEGRTLSHPEVRQLLGSLVSDPAEGDTATADTVVERLAEIGFPAVPYLLEALVDRRVVRLPSTYPGLKGKNLETLRVYHLADKALEEIFQKVSRMSLDIGPEDVESVRLRRAVIKGWEKEWSRFCPSYAETVAPSIPPATSGSAPGEASGAKNSKDFPAPGR